MDIDEDTGEVADDVFADLVECDELPWH
jgi:hypothetical protein